VVIWIVDHWVELILLLGFFIVLAQLSYILEAIRAVSAENVRATNSVGAQMAFELTKIKDAVSEISTHGYQTLNELKAIGHNVNDASEVLIYGHEARTRRILAEIEQRTPERERHFTEMREKAEAGDLREQGFYARYWAIREDYLQAHTWYSIATARAPQWQHGLEQRDQIARKMTPEQLEEAERQTREWLDAHPASPV
jgi:hypothetical protein